MRRTLALLAAVALALLAGCTDDGEATVAAEGPAAETEATAAVDHRVTTTVADEPPATTTSPTTSTTATAVDPSGLDEATRADVCGALLGDVVLPVGGPDDVGDADAARAAVETLVDRASDPLAADAAALLALDEAEEGDVPSTDALRAGLEALARVNEWALGACAFDVVVWACPATEDLGRFESVGEPIGGPSDETTTTQAGPATPEAAFAEADEGAPEGEPVEVHRSDDEVAVAWLDEGGHAVAARTAVRDGGSWEADATVRCLDVDGMVDAIIEPPTFTPANPPYAGPGECDPAEDDC